MYIRQSDLRNLKEYRYSGVDHSLVSRYILKPFYTNVFIHVFPLWMAYVFPCDFSSAPLLTPFREDRILYNTPRSLARLVFANGLRG